MPEKRWTILPYDELHTRALHAVLKINPILCRILTQRQIYTFEKAKEFFRPELARLHDPFLMKDMEKAVARIEAAIQKQEKILVYGDYDVDGTSSVASVFSFLKKIYDQVDFYIPHRYREGYGISRQGIDFARENNFTLVISLDCGIKSVELIAYARQIGIDFIVCDHHLPEAVIPEAVAVLNPKQADCHYPYKELCGCGVGFKLMQALAAHFSMPADSYLEYLDLAATAIAADIVPIDGENRILAYYGLKKINTNPSVGIKTLLELAEKKDYVDISGIVFIVAPRINAAGRMDDAKKAVSLFIEKDPKKAFELAKALHSDNTDRREADAFITTEALDLIVNDERFLTRKSTVVFRPHWHKGVVGIVASRLIETYYRPTIVLTENEGIVSGSARSVTGFNLYEAIHACREHLLGYGGHFAAAGLTLLPENVEKFAEAFEQVVAATIAQESLSPEIIIDTEISFKDITLSFYNIISQMEPFGPANMRPVFLSRNVEVLDGCRVVKEKHVKFVLRQHNTIFTGIGFFMSEKFEALCSGKTKYIDVVYTLDLNEWNGVKTVQLKVVDFRMAEI